MYRIKSLFVLVLCSCYFFARGVANKKITNPKKVAIMQMAKLGDMVCTTPMFKAVKEKYPKAEVYVIGNKINKELLEGNSDIDKYFVWEKNFCQLIKKIRKEKIDFACSTHPNFWGLAMLYLAGAKSIAVPVIKNGFSPVETKLYKLLRKFVVAIPHRMGNYAPREYLRLLEPVGIFSDNTKKYLYSTKQSEETIKKFFISSKINISKDFVIGISPSVGNKIKEWEIEKFAQLADYIYSYYNAKIVIMGEKNDVERSKEMIKMLNRNTKFTDTTGMFDLDKLKALMSKLSLFISVDTGPIYIAEAFGVPTVDIIGPIDEREQPPVGEKNKVVMMENRKQSVLHVMNAIEYDYKEARRQIEEITVNMVVNKLDELAPIIGLKFRNNTI